MKGYREIVIEENKHKNFHYSYMFKIYWIGSHGLRSSYNDKDIGRLIGHRSDYARNYIKKKFHGHWIYLYNGFFFSSYEEAEQAKEWLEAQILLQKLKNN